ncbi:MAG: hypothetical protein H6R02_819 [Burkholderiaceae bacterium]|jgi:hypothetical protein|nr:hypothetical protein [Burkholderiaceae bacterium]
MSEGPQYTSCVEAADFSTPSTAILATLGALVVVGGIAALFSAGIGALIAIAALVQLLRYVLNFMLNGKLICLHRTSPNCDCGAGGNTICAIGEVADTEGVGEDKNPIEDVDNDYAMNVILAPFNMRAFAANNVGLSTAEIPQAIKDKNHSIAAASTQPQGDLLHRELPPPVPAEEETLLNDKPLTGTGYYRTMIGLDNGDYHAWTELIGRDYGWFGIGPDQKKLWADYVMDVKNALQHPKIFPVPVLHCEFEGTRIRDMLAAIEAFSFGGKWCKSNWFTRGLCSVLQTIFAPLALIAVGIAWAAADDGNDADAVVGGGHVATKDWVVLRGRWAYDGGHTGWAEVHATRYVQKIDRFDVPTDPTRFSAYQKSWCERLSEVPHGDDPATHPLTPAQQTVADNQQSPENQWVLHPDVDGCEPDDPHKPAIR